MGVGGWGCGWVGGGGWGVGGSPVRGDDACLHDVHVLATHRVVQPAKRCLAAHMVWWVGWLAGAVGPRVAGLGGWLALWARAWLGLVQGRRLPATQGGRGAPGCSMSRPSETRLGSKLKLETPTVSELRGGTATCGIT